MFETFNKRGNRSKIRATRADKDTDYSPDTMYSAVEWGSDRPDGSRRLTNNYGKTAGKRDEYKPDVGLRSSLIGRMFNAAKDGMSRYRGF